MKLYVFFSDEIFIVEMVVAVKSMASQCSYIPRLSIIQMPHERFVAAQFIQSKNGEANYVFSTLPAREEQVYS